MHYIDTIIEHYGWQGTALAAAILILFFVQLYYHIVLYGRIVRFRNSRRKKILDAEPPVSVIVPLFSEDYNYLDERLPALFAQEYATAFEVVVVYVGADGDFYEELSRQRLSYPNLTVTKIEYNPRFPISVKMAINVGIKSASYNHLLLTTPSAMPASTQWLAMMGKAFMRGEIVLGYTGFEQTKGLANYLMRLSRLQMSVYWLTQAVSRNTYRGMRHNIGFTKELYFGSKGFTHLNMNIGEDDLFIQKIARRNNVSVVLIPKGTTIEHPWGGLRWFFGRLRYYGSAYEFYPRTVRTAIEWDLGSQVLFLLAALTAIVFMPVEFKAAAAALMLLRYAAALYRIRSIARRVGEKDVALRFFIFDLFNPLLLAAVRLSLVRKVPEAWR
ncbi:MAG: glycosyltransferase [Alistipes sp.]|nr:glycosyltransferase [Alistipes sp.]